MDASWAEKLQRYAEGPSVQSLKQCQEQWTRLGMDASLQQFAHPDMFKTLWGPILSRFLVTDNLTARFGLIWLLFTLWKKYPSSPAPKISVTLTIWRFFVRIYRHAKSVRQPRMRDISSCMLKMFRAQAFQPEHCERPLGSDINDMNIHAKGIGPSRNYDVNQTDGLQPRKRYRRNLQMITTNGCTLGAIPHAQVKSEGADNYLEAADVPVSSSFDLPPSCIGPSSFDEEEGFVPLSVLHADDGLCLDSLSSFDADLVVSPSGDSNEVLSWLKMESHDEDAVSLEGVDGCSDTQPHPIELSSLVTLTTSPVSSEDHCKAHARDERVAPYTRRSARRHGAVC